MLKISIPEPCHQDWDKMTAAETGRHCTACAKTVVDFTGMSDEAVQHYFINKKEDKVCGRFKQMQLQRIVIELPRNIFILQMPLWKKFLAACLIVFSTTLFSCETAIKGEPNILVENQHLKSIPSTDHIMLGGIGFSEISDSIKPIQHCSPTVGISFVKHVVIDTNEILKGDVEITNTDTSNSKQADTTVISPQQRERIFMGDSIFVELPAKKQKDSTIKTKNPPKADSTDCNTINSYY